MLSQDHFYLSSEPYMFLCPRIINDNNVSYKFMLPAYQLDFSKQVREQLKKKTPITHKFSTKIYCSGKWF